MKKTTKESSTESERMAALAKSYLDMMEKQMTATLTHPKLVETMMVGLQAMQHASAKMSDTTSSKPTSHEPAARHTAASPEPHADAIVRLERRVAFLERQWEQLRAELRSHADGKPVQSSQSAQRNATKGSSKPVHAKSSASVGMADGARSKTRKANAGPSKKRKTIHKK